MIALRNKKIDLQTPKGKLTIDVYRDDCLIEIYLETPDNKITDLLTLRVDTNIVAHIFTDSSVDEYTTTHIWREK